MTTENIIFEMLTENTGVHLLDSGGSNGRMWQRNQNKTIYDFRREDAEIFELETWTNKEGEERAYINRTVSVFHFLRELETDDICDRFNEINKDAKEWDADCECYGVSSDAWRIIEEYDPEIKHTFNTYNNDSDLSQILQGSHIDLFVDGFTEHYLILQIHGGADARGGYTNARLFKLNDEYIIHPYLQEYLYDLDSEMEYIENIWYNGKFVEFTDELKQLVNY